MQLFLGFVLFDAKPSIYPLLFLLDMMCNVVKSFVPGGIALVLKDDDLLTKATPELTLAILANPTSLQAGLELKIGGYLVLLLEVFLELRGAVAVLSAFLTSHVQHITAEGFKLEVLRVFVPLPI